MPTPTFSAHIDGLAVQAALQASAAVMPGVVVRPWQLPANYPSGVPPYEPTGFMTACDRDDLNALANLNYVTGSEGNTGRIGVICAAKMAIDYMACHERALHARHATPVRLRVWAAARRAGHGSLPYGVIGAFSAAVNDVAAAATAVPNAQSD